MFVYFFNDGITIETVNNLISLLHSYDKVKLYFSTEGGETAAMTVLIDYLNTRIETIEVVLTEIVGSAGTIILTDYKGSWSIDKDNFEFFLFHNSSRLEHTQRRSYYSEKEIAKQDTLVNERYYDKLIKIGFRKKDIKKLRKGKDVIYYLKDIHRFENNRSNAARDQSSNSSVGSEEQKEIHKEE